MRIIGGTHKGRRFVAPKSIPARPTTDYAKESLFNILENRINWSEVEAIDLFAGIGGLSFELASRGAKQVTCVDKNFHSIRWISKQQELLKLPIIAVKSDALKWLEKVESKYDLVVADPPYSYDKYYDLIELVLKKALVSNGLFILEHRHSFNFADHSSFTESRNYGEVEFSFFQNQS